MDRRYVLKKCGILLAQVLAVVVFLFVWQIAADKGEINVSYFSDPSAIRAQLSAWSSEGVIWPNVAATLTVFLQGYVIGTIAGIILGILVGTVEWFREVTEPFLAFFNAMPRLILLPMLIIWFGFGPGPKVILVAAVIFLMIAVNVSAGLRDVRTDLLDQARLMGASRWDLLRQVYVPSVALWVTTTARGTVGYAFNAAIAAEFLGATKGIGYLIVEGQSEFRADKVFAALTLAVVIAIIVDALLALVERRATRWQ